MTNDQGDLSQYNSNANIQNEANPHETLGAAGFLYTSSSHTESFQRFLDDLSVPNFLPHQERVNIIPSNDRAECVPRPNLDLNVEYVENGHYPNQNVSVGLSLHPYEPDGPEDQSDSNNFDSVVIHGGNSYIVNERGVDSSSVNMRFLSCNRSSERACRELLLGESSSTAVQARTPIVQAATSQVNASNSLIISAPHIGPADIQQQFQPFNDVRYGSANISPVSSEAGIGRGTTRSFYDGQCFNHARQIGNFPSYIHHQTAANQQALVSSGFLPMLHAWNSQVHLPSQTPWFPQENFPSFSSQAQTSVGTIPHVQPSVHVPNFHETQQPSPLPNVMGPRGVPASFSPVYNVRGGGTAEPFYNPYNNSRNIILGPQTGREAQSYNLANMNYGNITANYLGNFTSSSEYGSSSGSHLPNASSGAGNRSATASSHSPLNSGPSGVSQERGLAVVSDNARSQNQLRIAPRSENQSSFNTGPPYSAEARSNLVAEVQNTLQYLRNGGQMRMEELLILDYRLLLYLLEERNNHDDEEDDDENEEEYEQAEQGLSEEDILIHLRHATFQPSTPENVETCCICQEDYANGENIGVLDCRHKFHFDCIKQWLEIKNNCPICKQTGLSVIDLD